MINFEEELKKFEEIANSMQEILITIQKREENGKPKVNLKGYLGEYAKSIQVICFVLKTH